MLLEIPARPGPFCCFIITQNSARSPRLINYATRQQFNVFAEPDVFDDVIQNAKETNATPKALVSAGGNSYFVLQATFDSICSVTADKVLDYNDHNEAWDFSSSISKIPPVPPIRRRGHTSRLTSICMQVEDR